jgi:hypothetical protein
MKIIKKYLNYPKLHSYRYTESGADFLLPHRTLKSNFYITRAGNSNKAMV